MYIVSLFIIKRNLSSFCDAIGLMFILEFLPLILLISEINKHVVNTYHFSDMSAVCISRAITVCSVYIVHSMYNNDIYTCTCE